MECPQVAMSEDPFVADMYHTTSVGVAPRKTANKIATATSHREELENGDLPVGKRDITLLRLAPSLLLSEGLVVLTRSDCTTNIC